MTSAFTRVELTLECVSSKSVLRPGLLHLLQCRAFHSSLRDDMHYGPKGVRFPWSLSSARDSEPYCPWTYLNSCFTSKRRDLTKGVSVKVWQRDLGNSYIIDFPSAFCLASPTYGSKVPHGP